MFYVREDKRFRILNLVAFQMVYQICWIRLALTGSWLLYLEMSGLVHTFVGCAYSRNNCLRRTRRKTFFLLKVVILFLEHVFARVKELKCKIVRLTTD